MNSSQYLAWIEQSAAALSAAQDELTALDTAIGDGDHGLNIQRGFHKAVEKLHGQEGQDLGSLAKTTGMTLLSSVGGASYLGERSAGHKDPGAASSAIILHVLAEVLA